MAGSAALVGYLRANSPAHLYATSMAPGAVQQVISALQVRSSLGGLTGGWERGWGGEGRPGRGAGGRLPWTPWLLDTPRAQLLACAAQLLPLPGPALLAHSWRPGSPGSWWLVLMHHALMTAPAPSPPPPPVWVQVMRGEDGSTRGQAKIRQLHDNSNYFRCPRLALRRAGRRCCPSPGLVGPQP